MKSKQKVTAPFSWVKRLVILIFASISFFMIVLLLPYPYYTSGFRSLSELQQYAATLDEWIKMENDNELFPSYENYYKAKFTETFWRNWVNKLNGLLVKCYVKKPPLFSSSFFKELLTNVSYTRLKNGWQGDFCQKIEINEKAKVVVFGVVQGAFHSLVRYLEQLKKMDIIDEHLKLKDPNCFFVFLGNVVNRSPYTLEIFSVVLRLLQENPSNIIYLRGTNEDFNYWKSHTLKQELEYRCARLKKVNAKEKIPLAQEVNTFFDTLPYVLFGAIPYLSRDTELNYIRMSAYISQKRVLDFLDDENNYTNFLFSPLSKKLETFAFPQKSFGEIKKEDRKVTLRAIVTDILKRHSYQAMDGMRLLEPVGGIIAWTILSTPAEPYRLGANFFNEAFVIISPSKLLEDWLITLYFRDVREINRKSFNTRSCYFFSGKEARSN